jgi:hypothetical protein
MDDLEFRRSVFAEPSSDDKRMRDAAANDPIKQAFLNDVRHFDDTLKQALNIEVPLHLADRLILRQAIESHKDGKQRTKVHLAIAASVAFAIGVTVQMAFAPFAPQNIGSHTLAHLEHEVQHLRTAQQSNSFEQVNVKLARFGGQFKKSIGKAVFANYCDYEGVTSLHLIYEDENQNRISVFVTPKDGNFDFVSEFGNRDYIGKGLSYKNARVTVVGENERITSQYTKKVDQSLNWAI